MPQDEQYDAVVLGSGEAGKYMAWHLGGRGKRTAVIERKYLGGSCPNIACLPSKNVLHRAKMATKCQRGEEFGMLIEAYCFEFAGFAERNGIAVPGSWAS